MGTTPSIEEMIQQRYTELKASYGKDKAKQFLHDLVNAEVSNIDGDKDKTDRGDKPPGGTP